MTSSGWAQAALVHTPYCTPYRAPTASFRAPLPRTPTASLRTPPPHHPAHPYRAHPPHHSEPPMLIAVMSSTLWGPPPVGRPSRPTTPPAASPASGTASAAAPAPGRPGPPGAAGLWGSSGWGSCHPGLRGGGWGLGGGGWGLAVGQGADDGSPGAAAVSVSRASSSAAMSAKLGRSLAPMARHRRTMSARTPGRGSGLVHASGTMSGGRGRGGGGGGARRNRTRGCATTPGACAAVRRLCRWRRLPSYC